MMESLKWEVKPTLGGRALATFAFSADAYAFARKNSKGKHADGVPFRMYVAVNPDYHVSPGDARIYENGKEIA